MNFKTHRVSSSKSSSSKSPPLSMALRITLSMVLISSLPALNAIRVSPHSLLRNPNEPDLDRASSVVYDASLTRDLPLGKVMGSACIQYRDWMHFLGIPYALPPINDLRYRPPQRYNISYGSPALFAVSPHATCGYICLDGTQPASMIDSVSEDCLFVNVWAPKTLPSTLLPVRVYIHGGHDKCNSMDPHSEGCAAVAKTNSVQVTMEFRMGIVGHLAHPATWGESNTTGNWALMDQQMVLTWVQENIQFFGGDPNKVLLFGNSAGAQAVDIHVIAPQSDGLFHAAVSESPPCTILPTLEQAYELTKSSLVDLGCGHRGSSREELECLRQVPWDVLFSYAANVTTTYDANLLACAFRDRYQIWDYVIDGAAVPSQIEEAIRREEYSKVPYLVGTTADEGMTFIDIFFQVGNVSMDDIVSTLHKLYPGVDPNYILDVYPATLYASDAEPEETRLAQLLTDIAFTCPIYARNLARMEVSNTATWQYRWGATPSCPVEWAHLRAHHACELYFVFGIAPIGEYTTGLCTFTQLETQLSYVVLTAFTSLALDGMPKWGNGTAWPTWDEERQLATFIDAGITDTVDTKNMKARCERHRFARQASKSTAPARFWKDGL